MESLQKLLIATKTTLKQFTESLFVIHRPSSDKKKTLWTQIIQNVSCLIILILLIVNGAYRSLIEVIRKRLKKR